MRSSGSRSRRRAGARSPAACEHRVLPEYRGRDGLSVAIVNGFVWEDEAWEIVTNRPLRHEESAERQDPGPVLARQNNIHCSIN